MEKLTVHEQVTSLNQVVIRQRHLHGHSLLISVLVRHKFQLLRTTHRFTFHLRQVAQILQFLHIDHSRIGPQFLTVIVPCG